MKFLLLKLIRMASKSLFYGIMVQCFLYSMIWASEGNAQSESLDKTYIRIKQKEVTVKQLLTEVEKSTNFHFVYTKELLDDDPIVLDNTGRLSLSDLLMQVSKKTQLKFKQINNTIYLGLKQNNLDELIAQAELNQTRTVTGRVTSPDGETLPGVNVLERGTNNGTVTDLDGLYALEVADGAVLVFSFVGYAAQEINVGNRSEINVSLATDIRALDEIVVIGYGHVKRRDLTGSVSSVGSDDFNQGVHSSIDQLIQSRVPGVRITQSNAEPGGGVSVRIRGATSISSGNQPLYVIDGQPINNDASAIPGSAVMDERSPRNPLKALNPNDIESIEVLKDASATAIYGARGANGVIMITTKRGAAGRMQVNYSGSYSSQTAIQNLEFMNAQEYATFINNVRADAGQAPLFTQQEINAAGIGTDWTNELLRTAPAQDHQISFSGGSENTRYFTSLNFFDQQGVILNTGTRRYSGRLNLDHTEGRFNFGINLSTSYLEDDYVPNSLGANIFAGVMNSASEFDPMLPVRNAEGNFSQTDLIDLDNPVALASTTFDQAQTNRTFGNFFAEYELINNLSARVRVGSDRQVSRRDAFLNTQTKRGQLTNGLADIKSQERTDYLLETTLNYRSDFNQDHSINAVAGYTAQVFNGRGYMAHVENFVTDHFVTDNLGAGAADTRNVGSNRFRNTLISYLGRVNYSLLDRYLFTTSFRIDGSSKFGEGNKYGFFPSVALAWRLSDEQFVRDLNVFSDLKLRGSWGLTGNQEIGIGKSLILLAPAMPAIFNGTQFNSMAPIQLSNPNLKWETTRQFDIGLDFGFLEGRISGSFDYYIKSTYDLLLDLPIPSTTGHSFSFQNVGDTRNRGIDFIINTVNVTGNFNWATTLNVSTLKNEVINLGGLPQIFQGTMRFVNDPTILKVGHPMNSYYGYVVDGIFQTQQEIDGSAQPNAKPGDLKFRDITGGPEGEPDGIITAADRTILGDPIPNLMVGFNNGFNFKGFMLDVFFEGNFGHQMLNFTRIDSENPIEERRNRQTYVLDRWTPDNPSTTNPSFVGSVGRTRAMNSRVVEDASFVRLKNIMLGYNFPTVNIRGMRALTVYATAQNVLTFTNYSGNNPDVNALGDSNVMADFAAYPLARVFTVGINIGL
jgi:TonB-dependent starch-binding outer membrane protein SusC